MLRIILDEATGLLRSGIGAADANRKASPICKICKRLRNIDGQYIREMEGKEVPYLKRHAI
jgi:hypothetical protein